MIRVAINGYGRIGRSVLRALYESGKDKQIQLVAINELASPESIVHFTRYDTTHGRFEFDVSLKDNQLLIGKQKIPLYQQANIENLPWQELDVDILYECTGTLKDRPSCEAHLAAGAKKVLVSHPLTAAVDANIVYGVNQHSLKACHTLVSNASCTTNCVLPVINVLDKAFNIKRGLITTIHSAMNDQSVTDACLDDLRLGRAASQSIVPIETKLARGIERILPAMKGKFEAISVRVPTTNVTAIDLSVMFEKLVDIKAVNKLLQQQSQGDLAGIMAYSHEALVSCDFNHNPHSSIVDATQTRVSDGHLVKLLLWCDNEWGFANRMLDTSVAMMQAR